MPISWPVLRKQNQTWRKQPQKNTTNLD